MNEDRPGIAERVGKALAHGNLRQHDRSGRILTGSPDVDVVGALGLVGVRERLADAVYRLKFANDHHSYRDALAGVCGMALSLNAKDRWRYKRKRLHWMAKRVLNYWLNDACRLCTGVGYEVIPGSPHLSDRPCQRCHGTRKLAMPWVKRIPKKPEGRRVAKEHRQRWYEVSKRMTHSFANHRSLLVELEIAERRIADRMRTKLSRAA